MVMVLLPILIGALVIFIRALFQLKSLIQGNELSMEGAVLGICIPLLLIISTSMSWIKKGKVHHYKPLFYFPIQLFYPPLIIGIIFKFLPIGDVTFIRTALITWIVFAGILTIPLYKYHTSYMKKKGVKYFY